MTPATVRSLPPTAGRDVQPDRHAPPDAERADVTVIITVTERPEPLDVLYREYAAALHEAGRTAEFVFVAHPGCRQLLAPVRALAAEHANVRAVETVRAVGETTLLRLGLANSRAPIVVAVPAYRQVTVASVAALVEQVERGADLAVAWRWPRHDSWVNRAQHRALHLIAGRLAHGRLHDVASGMRAARREVLDEIPLYGDFVRFLPLIALYGGYRVVEVPVAQHPTDLRRRVYGPGVYLRRLIDVLGLFFLLRFTEKPLRFFGLIGSVLALIGALVMAMLLVDRLTGHSIGDRPLLLLGVLLVTLGIQAIALGLIGEMIVHFSLTRRRSYRVRATPMPTTSPLAVSSTMPSTMPSTVSPSTPTPAATAAISPARAPR